MIIDNKFIVSIEALQDGDSIETVCVTPNDTPMGEIPLSSFFSGRIQEQANGYRIQFKDFDLTELGELLQEIPGVMSVFITPPYNGEYSTPTHILTIQDISVIESVLSQYPIGTVVNQSATKCEIVFSPHSYLFKTEPQ